MHRAKNGVAMMVYKAAKFFIENFFFLSLLIELFVCKIIFTYAHKCTQKSVMMITILVK